MSAKHTDGPWNIFYEDAPYPGIDSAEKTIVLWGDDGEEAGVHGDTKEERIANARLMSAAPELLEAVETLLDCFVNDPMGWMNSSDIAIEKAYDAIHKAKGD